MTKSPTHRPLSVTVTAILFCLWGSTLLVHVLMEYMPGAFTDQETMFFEFPVISWYIALVSTGLLLPTGIGLWRLHPLARYTGIGMTCWMLCSQCITLVHTNALGFQLGISYKWFPVYAAMLYVLITHKPAFVRPPKNEQITA